MNLQRLSALASLSALFVSSSALAQQPAPAPPAAPQGSPTPAAAPAPAAGAAGAEAAPAEESTRFRWGISGYGGPLLGGLSGGAGGVDARFGAQISNMFGVYAQPMFLVGAGASSSVSGASASGVGLFGTGVLADATFSDLVYVAAGPELLLGGMAGTGASVGPGGTTVSAAASTGPYFSVAARAGLALGSAKPERRKAFTIGLDLRLIFNPGDPLIVPCLALGYEAF